MKSSTASSYDQNNGKHRMLYLVLVIVSLVLAHLAADIDVIDIGAIILFFLMPIVALFLLVALKDQRSPRN